MSEENINEKLDRWLKRIFNRPLWDLQYNPGNWDEQYLHSDLEEVMDSIRETLKIAKDWKESEDVYYKDFPFQFILLSLNRIRIDE